MRLFLIVYWVFHVLSPVWRTFPAFAEAAARQGFRINPAQTSPGMAGGSKPRRSR